MFWLKDTRISDELHEKLRLLRDRAFLLTLADTGLRVHEACNFVAEILIGMKDAPRLSAKVIVRQLFDSRAGLRMLYKNI